MGYGEKIITRAFIHQEIEEKEKEAKELERL